MIEKLLVANRGEIAVRIFRTCRRLGIRTVAVVAPDEAGSLHARSADETVEIAGYLQADEHVRAARETGAGAIHPGYGFLAESAAFAQAVEAACLVFVGPPRRRSASAATSSRRRTSLASVGVPVVDVGDPDALGFPLVIKAAAGGGGRGMRVVGSRTSSTRRWPRRAARRKRPSATAGSSPSATSSGRATSRSSCSRDTSGERVSLGERECSVQRRHQKVLEESPSTALDPALRARMSEAAVAFARAIGYRERRHRRVHARRQRLLVPGAERPHPGRAPGHRAGHGRRPRRRAARASPMATLQVVSWQRDTRSRCGSTPRIRARSSRRPAASSGCGFPPASAWTRASKRETRSGWPTTR